MKKIYISLLSVTLLVITSVFFYSKAKDQSWVKPKIGNIKEVIYGLGKVKSVHKYEVKIGVTTKVEKIYVYEGAFIKKGSKLIKFEDTKIFLAPFDGTVTLLPFDEGETLFPQTIAVKIENLLDRYIEVSLEQEGALRVRSKQKAKVLFESLRGELFEGEVVSIYPKNDEFLARIEVNELPPNILPGMTADVSILVGEKKQALLIPLSTINNGKILRKRNQVKEKIQVKIGGIDETWAEVIEGDIKLEDELLIKRVK